MAERFVVVGLAEPRAPWPRNVGRWATAAALPLEFVRCLSAEEVRARLAGGRRFSALLADGRANGVDRDLLALAAQHGCAVFVIDDPRVARDWRALGADDLLEPEFGRDQLRRALVEHATPVDDTAARTSDPHPPTGSGWRGPLVAVVGGGGAGTSTVAMALAQGAADDPRHGGRVVLADLCLDADLALLHDAREIVPGLPELVEVHRRADAAPSEVESLTFALADRGYRLLLGLRRHRDWTVLRPAAVHAALDGLRRAFHLVVVDCDADLEGEAECGSIDVEERNVLARTAVRLAACVVVVGDPGLKGTHRLVRLLDRATRAGVDPRRILTVVNRAPRAPRARAEITRALAELAQPVAGHAELASPIFLPERRRLDDLHRDAARLPASLTRPVTAAVGTVLDRLPPFDESSAGEPVPVPAGSVGTWAEGA